MNAQLTDIPSRFREKAMRSVNSLRPGQPSGASAQRYKLMLWGVTIPVVVVLIDLAVDAIARGQRR